MNCTYSGTAEGIVNSVRLDRYIAETLRILSRSQIKSRCLEAKLNGKIVKVSHLVKNYDIIELSWQPAAPLYLEPENIALDLIYEDDRCAVINKAQGMVVHPGAGNHSGTLANALLWRSNNKPNAWPLNRQTDSDSSLSYRNGIVHRLDKDTSGVIVTAFDDEALVFLSDQFKAKTVRKRYLAIVQGVPVNSEGRIFTRMIRDPRDRKRFTAMPVNSDSKPQGKIALTRYRTLKSWAGYSLLLLEPRTGRTHQLRVHLKYLGNPIVGDSIYNPLYEGNRKDRDKNFPNSALMLHALSLAIVIPGESEQRCFKAPIPDRFKTVIIELNRRIKKK
ncbi:MAG: RluA family pseudouridine synthase [Treponema sp.]|nr:RluA family pseudouridine synthase [Treponema sp.]